MDVLNQLAHHLEAGALDLEAAEYDEFIELLNKTPNIDPNYKYDNGYTILHKAAKFGSIECIQALMKRGMDINIRGRDGQTVFDAVKYRYLGSPFTDLDNYLMVKFLIESGADCNNQDDGCAGVFFLFGWIGSNFGDRYIKEILGLLLDRGCDRNDVYKGDTVETLLRKGDENELADYVRDYEVLPETKGVHIDDSFGQ